ncbi:MAG: hypothetical protein RR595_04730 [Lysinibacillus sp.]
MENFYSPSLTGKNVGRTKSFEVSSLFIVAIIGGLIAVSVLGILNAKYLKLEKKNILLLTFICIVLIFFNVGTYAIATQFIEYNLGIGRFFATVCFFTFFAFLNRPYKEHLAVGGETKSLYRPGLIWCIISIFIDGFIRNDILAL